MIPTNYTAADFHHSPFVVFYETTQACDLVCRHCRANAQAQSSPYELRTAQARQLLERFAAFPKPPIVVLTGGDPLKRHDLFELVRHGRELELEMAMTPSATPLVTREALDRLADMGLHRLAVSLDGWDAASHDAFRGVDGSFQRTLEILRDAREAGLDLQINTTITRRNVERLDEMAALVADFGVRLWSVFFLVPVGRGTAEARILPAQYEQVFARLWAITREGKIAVKTTEAPHYRRFVLQHAGHPQALPGSGEIDPTRAPLGVNDGRGVMFVSHTGLIYPSGFLPLGCGKFPRDDVVRVYQEHPLFCQLRDADQLEGKCGRCEFRRVCGGSRSRAYALSGNPLSAEPDCTWQPVAKKLQTVS